NGSTKTDLRLNLSEFECNQPDRKNCPETIRILTPAGDKDKSILDSGSLAPNASINLKATVSRLWRPGRWTAKLRNGQDEAGALTAIAIPPAYNIQIVSSTPDSPEIQFRARKALVTLQ